MRIDSIESNNHEAINEFQYSMPLLTKVVSTNNQSNQPNSYERTRSTMRKDDAIKLKNRDSMNWT